MAKKEFTDVDFEMFVMPFGTHKNKTIYNIPARYVLWIMKEDFCPEVLRAYAELYEEELREDADNGNITDYGYGDNREWKN